MAPECIKRQFSFLISSNSLDWHLNFALDRLLIHTWPYWSATKDGNAPEKTLNNELLTNISTYMDRHGLSPGAYVYVADAAFATEDNLKKADCNQTWFFTRLPVTYNEWGLVIREAAEPNLKS